jgi:hypothetical protein
MLANPLSVEIIHDRDRAVDTLDARGNRALPGQGRSKELSLLSDRGRIRIVLHGEEPAWLRPTLDRLGELLQLPEGWNSYRARRVEPGSAAVALNLLGETMLPTTPAPSIVPTPSGGIQLEWHIHGIDLEVGITPSGGVTAAYEDEVDGSEWEDELGPGFDRLASALTELSRRS